MAVNIENSKLQTPNSRPLLLEIGTEEIPSRFIPQALVKMPEILHRLFEENRIDSGRVSTMGTPRRLVIMVENLSKTQRISIREVIGPGKKVAYDESGKPTKAAYGFAKGQGVSVEDLKIKITEKGEYISAVFEEKGMEVEKLLPDILTRFITSIPFPKYMRWMDKGLKFARPIHWILALYGDAVIPFEIDGIKSGNITRGHRFMSPGVFQVKEHKNYLHLLENNYVILDQEKRKDSIEAQLRELSGSTGGKVLQDDELLSEIVYLVEYPVAVLGSFEEKYLELPKEVLINAMREHQRYFSVIDDRGNLLPYFITISNTKAEDMNLVRLGNERVIRARLEDAKFYFDEDKKKRLEERVTELKGVTYHEKLGTIYQKMERIADLSSYLSEKIEPDLQGTVKKAAYLCKADLVTGVVGEFPKLQGIMGKRYALLSGEKPEVAEAIYEHYLPKFAGDELPRSKAGAILSIADKMDSVAGFFSIGIIPSGSEDPYALRRQAQGIINILVSGGYRISLRDLIMKSVEPFMGLLFEKEISQSVIASLLDFFRQRLDYLLASEGNSRDIVDAVLSSGFDIPCDVRRRASAITLLRKREEFYPLLTALKRVINILPKDFTAALKKELLKEDVEKELYGVYMDIKPSYEQRIEKQDFSAAAVMLFNLMAPINNFFGKVLVMDKDEEIRENRFSLLKGIRDISLMIADFSKIK